MIGSGGAHQCSDDLLKHSGEGPEPPQGQREAEGEQPAQEEPAAGLQEAPGPAPVTRNTRGDGGGRLESRFCPSEVWVLPAAGFPERLGRAAPLDGGEVQGGRGRVVPRPQQHPAQAQETRGGGAGDEGQPGVAGQAAAGKGLHTHTY